MSDVLPENQRIWLTGATSGIGLSLAKRLQALLGEVTNTPWGERTRSACAVDSRRRTGHSARIIGRFWPASHG